MRGTLPFNLGRRAPVRPEELRDIMGVLMQRACAGLRRHGEVAPVAGIIRGGSMDMTLLEGDPEKQRRTLRRLAGGADGVILIADAPRAVAVACSMRDGGDLVLMCPYERTPEGFEFGDVEAWGDSKTWLCDLWTDEGRR